MEDRGSGYCSSPAALLSLTNEFLGFFPTFSALAQQRSPFLQSPALLLAALPNSSSKLTAPVGSGPGKRVL